jgi:hypothetical protein
MTSTATKLLLRLLGGSSTTSTFDPLTIPSLALWLDANDTSTLFQDDAGTTPATADTNPVGYWGDKSGNLRHAIQSTANNRPIVKLATQGAKNILRFDSTDRLIATFAAPLAQPNAIWIVAKKPTAGGYYYDSTGGTRHALLSTQPILLSTTNVTGAGVTTTDWNVFTGIYNGASSVLRANGAEVATGSAGAQALGGSFFISIKNDGTGLASLDLGEIIISNALPSAGLIAQVEAYLNAKWSVF